MRCVGLVQQSPFSKESPVPLSCSVSSVPETRNFTVSVTVPDNAYRLWVKWYSSANATGAGVNVNAGNPL